MTGLSHALRSRTVSVPAGGPTAVTTVSFDPATFVSVESNLVDGLAPLVVRSKFGRAFETEDRDGTVHRSFFDAYGRPYLTGDLLPDGSFVWRTWTLRNALGDAEREIELTQGNLAAIGLAQSHASALVTYPNNDNNQTKWKGLAAQHVRDIRGNRIAFWDQEGIGNGYLRDSIGRLVMTYGPGALPSFRGLDTAGRLVSLETTRDGTNWDRTRWFFDPATGLCTNKTYADGSRVARTFAADGLPLRTTLASGAWTQNAYDADRRLSSVSSSHSEDAYDLSYDAFGRVSEAEDNDALHVFVRDGIGRVTNELNYAGRAHSALDSVLSREYGASGRLARTTLEFWDDFRQSTCYTWGMDGNLAGMVLSNAQGRTAELSYEWEGGRFSGCDVYGDAGDCVFFRWENRAPRRPHLVTECGCAPCAGGSGRSFSYACDAVGRPVSRDSDSFAYDARGQVTNAVLDSAIYRYAYDDAGNRQSAWEDGVSTSYSANDVNQYTAVGSVQPDYDADGNLVDDGVRAYAWTAAGRLEEVFDGTLLVSSVYDWRGRRVERYVERFDGRRYELAEERRFVYDDWNLVHEYRYDADEDVETDIEYFWGPDLSGSLQGAGGVGGLVAVSVDGDYYFPGYDNNGNVIGYWHEEGDLVAEYAYDAFGNTIYEDGDMADFFPHRFSTKYYDSETDLYYYGYRYYSPSLGRWISRDPIEERGGLNLYEMCHNTLTKAIDPFGLERLVLRYETAEDGFFERLLNLYTIHGLNASEIATDITRRVGRYSPAGEGNCNCVEYLVLAGHGSPGSFRLGKDADIDLVNPNHLDAYKRHLLGDVHATAMMETVPIHLMRLFETIRTYLCDDSTIEFATCSSGAGLKGKELQSELEDFFGKQTTIILYKTTIRYLYNQAWIINRERDVKEKFLQ